jgi:hypothetical protein
MTVREMKEKKEKWSSIRRGCFVKTRAARRNKVKRKATP